MSLKLISKPFARKRKRTHHPGAAPGTLIAPEGSPPPQISVIAFSETELVEKKIDSPDELVALRAQWPMVWVDIDGLGDVPVVEKLGKIFGLHNLSLEDVLNLHQRAKAEYYDEYMFVVLPMADFRHVKAETEQLSLFLGSNFVITLQEEPGDCFGQVRNRLRDMRVRKRFLHSDYLAYAIIDSVVDDYFPLLEQYGDRLDKLEEEVVTQPQSQVIGDTHQIKRELQQLRHSLWPIREAINNFGSNPDLVHDETRPYLRDCYDHVIQVLDVLETYRERASGLVDIYLSSISNRMNEVMKVLTIISTIFMPLSFIASLYGMNFDPSVSRWNMPELRWRFGYPYALCLMAISACLMVCLFRWMGWLGGKRR